jgi:hypothetical protein
MFRSPPGARFKKIYRKPSVLSKTIKKSSRTVEFSKISAKFTAQGGAVPGPGGIRLDR